MKEYCLVPKSTVDRHLTHLVSDLTSNGNDTNKINDGVNKNILESPPDIAMAAKNTAINGGHANDSCHSGGGCSERGGRGGRGGCERTRCRDVCAGNRRGGGLVRSLIIPRSTFRKKINKKNVRKCRRSAANEAMTVPLPSAALQRLEKATPGNNQNTPINPSLEHLVGIFFKTNQQDYAKSLLEFYRKQSLIRWDELGQIQSPITGLNILDVIKYFASSSSHSFSVKEKELLKILHNFAPLPYDYMRSPAARRYLTGVHKAGGNVKVKPMSALMSAQSKMRWNPY